MSLRIGLVSTYFPTKCGLATFTSALLGAITASGEVKAEVVRLVNGREEASVRGVPPEVIAHLDTTDAGAETIGRAAAALDAVDVAILQFEYGIFGGPDGAQAIALLDELRVPSMVVHHTVLSSPTPGQRRVMEAVNLRADRVIVLSDTAGQRLIANYGLDPDKLITIPHGALDPVTVADGDTVAAEADQTDRVPTILTWGLIGPGKGIEWGIDAIAQLRGLDPAPRYVVAGQTHPKVVEREGEQYRHGLLARAAEHGVADQVVLDGRYRDKAALAELIAAADVVLLPYESREQISSGVLIEAVAAGIPVVATRFPHAVELLSSGAGLLVEQNRPDEMAAALRTVLTDPAQAAAMRSAAATVGADLSWPSVAAAYIRAADGLAAARLPG